VFLYVVRDLDRRTERVIEYLTTRPRIPLFVVEVTTTAQVRPHFWCHERWASRRG
jgi:hypothetical protein